MGKRNIPRSYKELLEDQRAFDGWLRANAIISLIFAAGLVAMAVAGFNATGSRDAAVANNAKASDLTASEQRRGRTGILSAHEFATRDRPLRH
jgi:hypothetical protein